MLKKIKKVASILFDVAIPFLAAVWLVASIWTGSYNMSLWTQVPLVAFLIVVILTIKRQRAARSAKSWSMLKR